jgi:hypothetical protein
MMASGTPLAPYRAPLYRLIERVSHIGNIKRTTSYMSRSRTSYIYAAGDKNYACERGNGRIFSRET